MKAIEQYFPVVLFIMLHKIVLTCKSVVEILKRDHSNENAEQYFPSAVFVIGVVFFFNSLIDNATG